MSNKAYRAAARCYQPSRVRVLFIAESPPAYRFPEKRSYFFFLDNPGGDILFATVVKALYDIDYRKDKVLKQRLLTRMKQDGYWLIDAVEYPINRDRAGKLVREKERKRIILDQIPGLLDRLAKLATTNVIAASTGIVLVKKAVFDTLDPVLTSHDYRVLNTRKIDFPKYYRDRDTVLAIKKILS